MQFNPPGNMNTPQFFRQNVLPLCSLLSPPPPPPSPPSPPPSPITLTVHFFNNETNGYTTVKAIHLLMALQTLNVPYSANATYLNNTGTSSAVPLPSYKITYSVGPFNKMADATSYANLLVPKNFAKVKNVHIKRILYTLH